MEKSRLIILSEDIKKQGIAIGFFGLAFFLYVLLPLYLYIALEGILENFYNVVESDPEAAERMIGTIIKYLYLYNVSLMLTIGIISILLLAICWFSSKILSAFKWDISSRIIRITGFVLVVLSVVLIVLNSLLTVKMKNAMMEYLIAYAHGENYELKRTLLQSVVSFMFMLTYIAIGVALFIVFIAMDTFSGNIGLFKNIKPCFKALTIGTILYIIEMFIMIPLSIIVIPAASFFTSRRLRKLSLTIKKYKTTEK